MLSHLAQRYIRCCKYTKSGPAFRPPHDAKRGHMTMSTPDQNALFKTINDDFAVAGQLDPGQIPAIAEAGFKTVICNRPDGEAPAEPQFDAISAAASAAGLETRYIPVSNQVGLTPENVTEMKVALAELPGPVLAYCRSGARSAKLYEIAAG